MDGTWLLKTATTVAAAVALAAPSPATAAPCPPEQTVAALDQYCEALPGVGGMAAPTASGPGGAAMPPLRLVLPAKEVESLRKAGPAAMALLQLPVVAPPLTQEDRRRADVGAREVVASGALDSPKGDVPGVASGLASAAPDVVSGAFRWALVISSLGLAAMAWLRFRSRLTL